MKLLLVAVLVVVVASAFAARHANDANVDANVRYIGAAAGLGFGLVSVLAPLMLTLLMIYLRLRSI